MVFERTQRSLIQNKNLLQTLQKETLKVSKSGPRLLSTALCCLKGEGWCEVWQRGAELLNQDSDTKVC